MSKPENSIRSSALHPHALSSPHPRWDEVQNISSLLKTQVHHHGSVSTSATHSYPHKKPRFVRSREIINRPPASPENTETAHDKASQSAHPGYSKDPSSPATRAKIMLRDTQPMHATQALPRIPIGPCSCCSNARCPCEDARTRKWKGFRTKNPYSTVG